LAVAPNTCHLRFVSTCVSLSGSALHELGPAQDHALGEGVVTIWRVIFIRFRMFHRHTFVLGAPVRSLVVPLHIILRHRTTLPSFQHRTHFRVARPIQLWLQSVHRTFLLMTPRGLLLAGLRLYKLFFLFFPFLLTLMRSIQLSLSISRNV